MHQGEGEGDGSDERGQFGEHLFGWHIARDGTTKGRLYTQDKEPRTSGVITGLPVATRFVWWCQRPQPRGDLTSVARCGSDSRSLHASAGMSLLCDARTRPVLAFAGPQYSPFVVDDCRSRRETVVHREIQGTTTTATTTTTTTTTDNHNHNITGTPSSNY